MIDYLMMIRLKLPNEFDGVAATYQRRICRHRRKKQLKEVRDADYRDRAHVILPAGRKASAQHPALPEIGRWLPSLPAAMNRNERLPARRNCDEPPRWRCFHRNWLWNSRPFRRWASIRYSFAKLLAAKSATAHPHTAASTNPNPPYKIHSVPSFQSHNTLPPPAPTPHIVQLGWFWKKKNDRKLN